MNKLDLYVYAEAFSESDQAKLLEALSCEDVCWSILDPEYGALEFSVKEMKDGDVHLYMDDYIPKKVLVGQREAYFFSHRQK